MSRSFKTNKNLVVISLILNWIFAIPLLVLRGTAFSPYINYVLGAITIFLFFIGMKGLAEHYKDKTMYQNARKIIIYNISTIITAIIITITANFAFTNFTAIFNGGSGNSSTATTDFPIVLSLIALLIIIIFAVLIALCYRKILRALADHTGKQDFRTASDLIYYGLILSIVFIGFFLILGAIIIMAIAIYSLKETDTKIAYCTQCGTPNTPENTFCPNCGKQFQ